MRALGVIILAGVGYYAYKNRATLLGGGMPVAVTAINTPAGAILPIVPSTPAPSSSTISTAPGNVTPIGCTLSGQQMLERAVAWTKSSDRSWPSLIGSIRNVPPACRKMYGERLKIAGVPIATVNNAVAAAG